jgi:hypothetical protein
VGLSLREQKLWNEIQHWENQLEEQDVTDFQLAFDKWLNRTFSQLSNDQQNEFFARVDGWLFHLHALIHSSQSQLDARNRILSSARLFDETIEYIEDLRKLSIDQLMYIAENQIARHRLYSFVQGGATGAGGFLFLSIDFPVMIAINLKAVQIIATSYGYNVNRPYEMMLALKVFHASILPLRMQQAAWYDLVHDIKKSEEEPFFYEGVDEVIDSGSLLVVLKQSIKMFVIHSARRKLIQGIPIIGVAVGSVFNYRLTRNVTDFAHRFYQMRYLYGKQS